MNASPMVHSLPSDALHRVHSIAYAGTDLLVHLVCTSKTGQLHRLCLGYSDFSRLIRERADRREAIALLSQLGKTRQAQGDSGLRHWTLLDVISTLGHGLLIADASLNDSRLQKAA